MHRSISAPVRMLGAPEGTRTPDLLIRSQTLYPTELPAQVQDIYYHRHRGLSTVFAKKFKVFFAKQKKVVLPPSGGGRRAFFSAADRLLARAVCAQGCPRAPCGAPMRPAVPPCALAVPPAPLRCPLRALGLPYTLRVALRASRSLAAHRAPQYRARLSPAQPHGREKARPLQKERPGLVHFAVRR